MNTLADLCGVSGLGNGPGGRECNLFNPGVFNPVAATPVYELYQAGSPGYNTEYDNFAPNIGVAWQPNVQSGWLRAILGDPAQATIRGSYGVCLQQRRPVVLHRRLRRQSRQSDHHQPHVDEHAVPAGARRASPGPCCCAIRNGSGRRPAFPPAPVYPMAIDFNSGVNLFHPNFRTPYSRSFSVGLQRALGRHMAVEVRYVGTRLADGTATEELERGQLDEQRLPRRVQARAGQPRRPTSRRGRGNSFAFFGAGHRHVAAADLPGELQRPAAERCRYTPRSTPAPTGRTRRVSSELAVRNPNPAAAANTLFTTAAFRTNLATAGFASNFFVLNPGGQQRRRSRTNGESTQYDSLQMNCAARWSAGWRSTPTTSCAKRYATRLDTLREERPLVRSTAGRAARARR